MEKKLLSILLTVLLISPFYSASSVLILPGAINYSAPKKTMEIAYPIIASGVNISVQEKINQVIKRDIDNFNQYFQSHDIFTLNDLPDYFAKTTYSVEMNDNNLLSITIIYYEYTGGAHGNYNMVSYVFDTVTGQRITSQDLFQPGFNFKEILIGEVETEISKNPQKYFEDASNTVLESNFSFYLKPGFFVVFYGLYDIAPYSSGIPEFPISTALLKEGLKIHF